LSARWPSVFSHLPAPGPSGACCAAGSRCRRRSLRGSKLPELSDEELDALLVHELAHVRRRDHWLRIVEILATALFWWYPVAWWLRRSLRRVEERCCDEWVLRLLPGAATTHARGLLKAVAFTSAGTPPYRPLPRRPCGPPTSRRG